MQIDDKETLHSDSEVKDDNYVPSQQVKEESEDETEDLECIIGDKEGKVKLRKAFEKQEFTQNRLMKELDGQLFEITKAKRIRNPFDPTIREIGNKEFLDFCKPNRDNETYFPALLQKEQEESTNFRDHFIHKTS